MKRFTAHALLFVCLLCASTQSFSHTRSESYSNWYITDSLLTGTVTIPLREVMLLYSSDNDSIPPKELFREHLNEQTTVFADATQCEEVSNDILQAASGFIRIELRYDCSTATPSSVQYRALFDVAPTHVHYARLHRDGYSVSEYLISDTADTFILDDGSVTTASYTFSSFVSLGISHIATGIDHIAFLIGMLLIARSLGRSMIAVTGFTIGHSISLAAAVLGYVHADGTLVEAFIGFTVALVAVEYFALRRSTPLLLAGACMASAWLVGAIALSLQTLTARASLAYAGFGLFAVCYLLVSHNLEQQNNRRASMLLFVATGCFGLVHGFGFAGFLMETGVLGSSLFIPLLGFNLGVEIGQLALVGIGVAAATMTRRYVPSSVVPALAASLAGIGVFWFVNRTLV